MYRDSPRAPEATLEDCPKILRDLTRTPVWGTLAAGRPIRLSTACTGLLPVMAAEAFLPLGKLEAVSVVDTTFGSPRLMQSRNQHRHTPTRPGRPTLARRAPSDRLTPRRFFRTAARLFPNAVGGQRHQPRRELQLARLG